MAPPRTLTAVIAESRGQIAGVSWLAGWLTGLQAVSSLWMEGDTDG